MDFATDLLDLEEPGDINISPDGTRVVYCAKQKWKAETNPESSIWIASIHVPNSARRVTRGFNEYMPQWSTNSEGVAFLSDRGNRGKACAIFHLALEEDEPTALTPASDERIISKFKYSPDCKTVAFLAAKRVEAEETIRVWNQDWNYHGLHLLDVRNRSVRVLFERDLHVDDLAWSDNGQEIAILTYRSPHIEKDLLGGATFFIVNVADAQARTVCTIPLEASCLTWAHSSLFFVSYSDLAVDISSRAVYSVDVLRGNTSPERRAHGYEDCAEALVKIGDNILVHVLKGMDDCLQVLDGAVIYKEKKAILDFHAIVGENHEVITAIVQGSVQHPPEVVSICSQHNPKILSSHGATFADARFGSCTFLDCQSFDGLEKLEGMYLSPDIHVAGSTEPRTPLPTVVLLHGGPYYRVTDSFNFMDHFFMPLILLDGFGILVPNYRGSSGRGERFAKYARGGLGIYDEPDVVAMTQLAITEGFADPRRLLVAGRSQGGFLSYLSSVRNGKHGLGWRYQGAIAFAGVSDWDTLSMSSDIGYAEASMAGGAPWSFNKGNISARSGSAIWEFKAAAEQGRIPPMLLLHGGEDVRVPISQADGFRRALDQAGLPFEFVTYTNEGHFFQERKSAEDLVVRIMQFIRKHLSLSIRLTIKR